MDRVAQPTWTRLLAGSVELSNSIEWAHWDIDLVWPIVCERCGHAGCAYRSRARIVRLGKHVLWLPSQARDLDEFRQTRFTEANVLSQCVLIPAAAWDSLRDQFPKLPAARSFAPATRGDAAAIWLGEMPAALRPSDLSGLETRMRDALASDPLDLEPARTVIGRLVAWVQKSPEEPIEGRLVRSAECPGGINTLYFDGPPFEEWPAFAVESDISFVLGSDWVLLQASPLGEPPA